MLEEASTCETMHEQAKVWTNEQATDVECRK